MMSIKAVICTSFLIAVLLMDQISSRVVVLCDAFAPPVRITRICHASTKSSRSSALFIFGQKKTDNSNQEPLKSEISEKRRKQLGISDDEREYDLGVALETNTDPLITKIIAGSFILVVIALLVAGIVVPSLTDYGEGVCNPIRSGGRC